MNEELKHLTSKAINSLQLAGDQAEYLSNIIELAYKLGDRNGFKEAGEILIKKGLSK